MILIHLNSSTKTLSKPFSGDRGSSANEHAARGKEHIRILYFHLKKFRWGKYNAPPYPGILRSILNFFGLIITRPTVPKKAGAVRHDNIGTRFK